MQHVEERLLESKMTEVEQARSWIPRVVSKFEALIRQGEDFSLYRVNPLAYARDRSMTEAEGIDLFLHAARCGLFNMSWDVVCPQSGMVLDSFGALRTLKTHYVCGLCDVSGDTDLDDFIEVTFTVSPEIRRLPFHDPASLSVEDFHWKARFLSDGRLPGQQVRFLDVLSGLVRGLSFLPPGSVTSLPAELGAGALAGHQRADAGELRGARRRRTRRGADALAGQVRRQALSSFAVGGPAWKSGGRGGELVCGAWLVAPDQLAT